MPQDEQEPAAPAPSSADLHPGAHAYTADGVHVGTLHRVIVDGESFDLRELVIEETRHFSGHALAPGSALMCPDVVVPLSALAGATRERVDLTLTAAQVRALPPYLSYRYGPPEAGDEFRSIAAEFGQTPWVRPLTETAAKQPGELEIRAGEHVMLGRTGRRLGEVRDVLVEGGELVGIVVKPEGFFHSDVVLQVRFLDRSDDLALFANLTPEDVEHLQPFHPDR